VDFEAESSYISLNDKREVFGDRRIKMILRESRESTEGDAGRVRMAVAKNEVKARGN